MYEIEKSVPVAASRATKYPFKMMEVGDSFLIPKDEIVTPNQAHSAAKSAGVKVRTRMEKGGMRVWRIS